MKAVLLVGLLALSTATTESPRVLRTFPANGEEAVDPELKTLRIIFDQPMIRTNWSVTGVDDCFPRLLGKPWWDDDRVFLSRWSLRPGRAYRVHINAEGTENLFCTAEGESVAPYLLTFRTAGEPVDDVAVYRRDLMAFLEETDRTYPFWELKEIRDNWERTRADLLTRVEACDSDSSFLGLIQSAIRSLRDVHMRLVQVKASPPPPPPASYPGLSFMPATEDRVVVMAVHPRYGDQLRPGDVVTRIDGAEARATLEAESQREWETAARFRFSSPQRADLYVWRLPFLSVSEKTEVHSLTYLRGGEQLTLEVASDVDVRSWPRRAVLLPHLKRVAGPVLHTQLDSGVGYLLLPKVSPETEVGIGEALHAHPVAKGWIVDLRGNSGGGYDGRKFAERVRKMPRPVVVLIDAGCISAGETLARDLRRNADAHLMGSRTAGSSSTKREWSFPSGIARVRFSVRSRYRTDGKPIEFNGITPDEDVQAVPEDVVRGHDTLVLRAEEYINQATQSELVPVRDSHPVPATPPKGFP